MVVAESIKITGFSFGNYDFDDVRSWVNHIQLLE
jgi:hypothetical protein